MFFLLTVFQRTIKVGEQINLLRFGGGVLKEEEMTKHDASE